MVNNVSCKKPRKLITLLQKSPQKTASFWKYETHEDRLARNLWVSFMIGLAIFSCLGFLLI